MQNRRRLGLLGLLLWLVTIGTAPAQHLVPQDLATSWDREIPPLGPPQLLDHALLDRWLKSFVAQHSDLFTLEEAGRSLEDRSINHVWFGRGPMHVLLWSQMHGDEPTATSALLGIMEYVSAHRTDIPVRRMLERLTLHVVPMLNPDGAERFQRRNAQGIDINRDALLLQTPEGRTLKALRDRLQPALGFNLHNQNWRTSVGDTKRPASISLLAVAFDEARSENPGRILAKKSCALLRDTLETFIPGQVARYDDEFEVRAFGDNVTKWGTPVVLVETGPAAGDTADLDLVRLNFVGLMKVLDAVASGEVMKADPARYEQLPMNESDLFTVLIRNATIVVGTGIAPFTGDLGLTSSRIVRTVHGSDEREAIQMFRIEDLGDLRVFGALETVDASGMVLVPRAPEWGGGEEVVLRNLRDFRTPKPLAVGTSLDLALLQPVGPGRYKVARLFPTVKLLGRSRPLATATGRPTTPRD
jgi:hypothetical protein